eukprot:TRINITY_DN57_c0_g2_i1.p2 TRINITY_DN57_c0_g2~~TRINITY_DN57_c0_g2_i1.p2  ORF type:complete len:296 (-),score=146.10 TRINITY_DN57_c0_g2_i1:1344-2231(-)
MSLDIRLNRVDRIYRPNETVSGVVVVSSKGPLSHNGVTLTLTGDVTLQLSSKSTGLFEAFYSALKPIQLLHFTIEVAKAGRLPDGVTELPFEFKLLPLQGQNLHETYHGVFVNIQYALQCDMPRGILAKALQRKLEFLVESNSTEPIKDQKVDFKLTNQSLSEMAKAAPTPIPSFSISGFLTTATCNITKPLSGELTVESCDAVVRSVEIQLVRVETCGCADGFAKEATEIQNIQIGDGDIPRGIAIPIYMIFPRLFTCPSIATRTFKIEFEVNLIIMFEDGTLVSENFKIKLVR